MMSRMDDDNDDECHSKGHNNYIVCWRTGAGQGNSIEQILRLKAFE